MRAAGASDPLRPRRRAAGAATEPGRGRHPHGRAPAPRRRRLRCRSESEPAGVAAGVADELVPNAQRRPRPALLQALSRAAAWLDDPLHRRAAATVALLLAVRAVSFVPLPGFCSAAPPPGQLGNVVDLLLPGGAAAARGRSRPPGLGVAAMGVSPYVASSIALSLALTLNPQLRAWRKDAGAAGTDVIVQAGRRLGLAASLLQATYTAFSLRPVAAPVLAAMPLHQYIPWVAFPLAAGTSITMWLGEEITRAGLGQGMSVVISLSIVGSYADALRGGVGAALASGTLGPVTVAAALAAAVAHTAACVLVCEGVRKVPIVFFQLQGGAQAVAGGAGGGGGEALRGDHIPFRCNPTGVQPVIFAMALLDGLPWALRAAGANPAGALLGAVESVLRPGAPLHSCLFFAVVFVLTLVDVEDTPAEVADYALKVGARVPGVRPGAATVAHLRATQLGARVWGGLLLACLALVSSWADAACAAAFGRPAGFTSMIIVTGTALQMRRQAAALAQRPALSRTLEILR